MLLNTLQCTGTRTHNKELPSLNAHSAVLEKPCFGESHLNITISSSPGAIGADYPGKQTGLESGVILEGLQQLDGFVTFNKSLNCKWEILYLEEGVYLLVIIHWDFNFDLWYWRWWWGKHLLSWRILKSGLRISSYFTFMLPKTNYRIKKTLHLIKLRITARTK